MSQTDDSWARAYAKQALSDLDAREALVLAGVSKCHRLHFLQMAAEKTCKAYFVKTNGHQHLKKSHAYVKTILPQVARGLYSNLDESNVAKRSRVSAVRHFAREIELLAPACNDGGRDDNSEYPWTDGTGEVKIPCEYSFPNIDDLSRNIVPLIRLIRSAAELYKE